MPIFLNRDQLYRIFQRELPLDVYPDGAPTGFLSAASLYAKSKEIEDAYTNLETIYTNEFPQLSVERIGDWELKVFGKYANQSLSLGDRQIRVVSALRTHRGITRNDIIGVVQSILPNVPYNVGSGIDFELIEWCFGRSQGGWMLDFSELDIDTYLSEVNGTEATGADPCINTPAQFGLTQEQWNTLLANAYTYEVRIYNYTLSSLERMSLDQALSAAEPARSDHVITDGLTDAQRINGSI